MDLFLIGAVTFFVLLISSLIWYSNRQHASRLGGASSSFLNNPEDPAALVRLQLAELLSQADGEKFKNLGSVEAFDFVWKAKEAFEEFKSSSAGSVEVEDEAEEDEAGVESIVTPGAAAGRLSEKSSATKAQMKKLLQYRANELIEHILSVNKAFFCNVDSSPLLLLSDFCVFM
jgi:hypothetical protein